MTGPYVAGPASGPNGTVKHATGSAAPPRTPSITTDPAPPGRKFQLRRVVTVAAPFASVVKSSRTSSPGPGFRLSVPRR